MKSSQGIVAVDLKADSNGKLLPKVRKRRVHKEIHDTLRAKNSRSDDNQSQSRRNKIDFGYKSEHPNATSHHSYREYRSAFRKESSSLKSEDSLKSILNLNGQNLIALYQNNYAILQAKLKALLDVKLALLHREHEAIANIQQVQHYAKLYNLQLPDADKELFEELKNQHEWDLKTSVQNMQQVRFRLSYFGEPVQFSAGIIGPGVGTAGN